MRVSHNLPAQRRISRFTFVRLPECNKELLIAGESLVNRRGLVSKSGVITIVSGCQPAEIGYVFRQGLLAVQRKIRERLVCVVLLGQLRRGSVEVRQVGWFPPISQSPFIVEGAAFGIERVADFVSND